MAAVDEKRYVLRYMPSQKRTPKRAGGRAGDAFRQKLEQLVSEAGSQRAFARKLWEDVGAKVDRSPRVGEWRRGRNLPKSDSLQLIAKKFDVSVDWLLGFPVSRRRSEREPLGNLGRALVNHVVRDYARRTKRERRDGLANAMGGALADADSPRPAKRGDPLPPVPNLGEELPDGRLVVHRSFMSLRVIDVDAVAFLERVCERVFHDAEEWEEQHKESEREAVRKDVRILLEDAGAIAESFGRTRENVLEELLAAALDPLDRGAQAGVVVTRDMWRGEKARKAYWETVTSDLLKRTLVEMGLTKPEGPSGG